MPPDILALFERYRDAFNRLDGDAIARLYAIPSGIASDTGYMHWPTLEPIRANMAALCESYRDNGYVSAQFEPESFLPQGPHFAIVDLAWIIDRSEGREPWRFNTTYNLMRAADGWWVLLCTAYGERKLNASAAP